MPHSNAFALLEFLLGVVVMGLIGIFGAKMLVNLQVQNHIKTLKTHNLLETYNALDTIENYLLEANISSVVAKDYTLSWVLGDEQHNIAYQNNAMYLDGMLVLENISDFKIYPDTLEIFLCRGFKNPLCIKKFFGHQ